MIQASKNEERALQDLLTPDRLSGAESIYRAVTAIALGKARENGEANYLRKFADDRITRATDTIIKAATSPATIGNWGGTLAESL